MAEAVPPPRNFHAASGARGAGSTTNPARAQSIRPELPHPGQIASTPANPALGIANPSLSGLCVCCEGAREALENVIAGSVEDPGFSALDSFRRKS